LRHECIILEPDDTPPSVAPPSSANTSSSTPNLSSPAVPLPSSHPKHTIHPPVLDDDLRYDISSYGHCANVTHAEAPEPKTYDEAMASSNAVKWLATCKEEMRTWKDLDIYDIIPWPKGHKIIGSKWVFCIKWGPDGTIQKHKARIVAQGFTQIKGMDFDQTFTPIAKFQSLHTVFALAAEHNLEVHQMDIKATYLNTNLKEDLYMEPPPGFNIPKGHVLKLKKGMYGTRQGGHVWYEEMRGMLTEMGYTQMEADHAIFVCDTDGFPDIITLYVDNMGLISESLECILQDKEALSKHYQMTDLSEMGWILGIQITHDHEKGTLALS